jgi:hypothetical protein
MELVALSASDLVVYTLFPSIKVVSRKIFAERQNWSEIFLSTSDVSQGRET